MGSAAKTEEEPRLRRVRVCVPRGEEGGLMEEMRRRREVEILGGKGEEQALRVRHYIALHRISFLRRRMGVRGSWGWRMGGGMDERQAGRHAPRQ